MKLEFDKEQELALGDLMKDLPVVDNEENRQVLRVMLINYAIATFALNIGLFQSLEERFPVNKKGEPQEEITPYRCPKCKTVLVRPYPEALLQCNCRKWKD